MKFGFRIPSLNKRIAARASVKRIIRHNLGFKAPRGIGWPNESKESGLQSSLQQNNEWLHGYIAVSIRFNKLNHFFYWYWFSHESKLIAPPARRLLF